LENDVINSIKELDFETMSVYSGKVKLSKKELTYYENAKKSIIDLELNEKVQSIIEKEPISSVISLKYTKKEKEFKIEKGKLFKEVPVSAIFTIHNEKKKICPTIESFVYQFPDFSKIQQLEDIGLFQLEEELKFTNELFNYFKLIKGYLNKNLNIVENSEEFENINNKIFDYVMEKIYDKIYPKKPSEMDNNIYRKCLLLSWVKPKHISRYYYNYIYDFLLTDIISYVDKIEKEKSPRKKLLNLSQIFVSIENAFNFYVKTDLGVDDQLPILNYALIKAHPLNISTNYQFMSVFSGSKRNKLEGWQLCQLESICESINNMRYDYLYDMTEEIFKKNCSNFNDI
jgi:hypothetical protein